jgi:hypothetical protein
MNRPDSELSTRTPPPGPGREGAADSGRETEDEALPGTLFLLMLFLAGVVGLWGTVYWMLLTR